MSHNTKETAARGETQGGHKVTEEDVRAIRRLYELGCYYQWQLALQFGLHQTTISKIVLRKTWTHI